MIIITELCCLCMCVSLDARIDERMQNSFKVLQLEQRRPP